MHLNFRSRRGLLGSGAVVIALVTTLGAPPAVDAAASTVTAATPYVTSALHDQIQARIDNYAKTNQIAGISLAVVTPDRTGTDDRISQFVTGVPTVGSSSPVSATTQFELGSETKAFTADLLAYLVASNRVALDDPVQKYAPSGITVPEWTDPATGEKTPILLRDLATHQSGLDDFPPNAQQGCPAYPTPCANPRPGYTQTLLWNAVANYSLLWKPGTNYLYSDWAYGLLGTILSNVVNPTPESQPPAFGTALDAAFLQPLGLASTAVETSHGPSLVTPYFADGTPAYYWDNTNALSGGGALVSDLDDMGVWTAANLGFAPAGAPLGVRTMPNSVQPVSTITTVCSDKDPTHCGPEDFQMGLAWQLYPASRSGVGAPYAVKDGATAGCTSYTALAPGLRTGVTLMFNKNSAVQHGPDDLAVPILALLVAAAKADPAPATPTPTPPTTTTTIPTTGGAVLAATGPTHAPWLLVLATTLLIVGVAVQRVARPRVGRPSHRSHRGPRRT